MPHWLDPVRATLDALAAPATVFIRDDDAGWGNDRLYRLLEVTEFHSVPIDLAAIPAAMDLTLAGQLRHLVAHSNGRIAVHQHGFAHLNHQTAGRKSEFGDCRLAGAQRDDLQAGRRMLEDRLGDGFPSLFTPPWNRCTAVTAEILVELGYRMLSRDAGATPFSIDRLCEFPVHLDWTGRRGVSTGIEAWGSAIAGSLTPARAPVGLMLHHEMMSGDDRRWLAELLAVATSHSMLRFCSMSQAVTISAAQYPEAVNR
jgi:hypothetical protein